MPNAIDVLTHDHQQVRELLGRLEQAAPGWPRTDLLDELASALKLHSRQEEEIFYPEFRRATRTAEAERIYYRAVEEHGLVERTLEELQRTDPRSEQFAARARVLRQLVEPHADEEEKLMFPLGRQVFDAQQLETLGARMQALRGGDEGEHAQRGRHSRGAEAFGAHGRPRTSRPHVQRTGARSGGRASGGGGSRTRAASWCNGFRLALPTSWCSWLF